MVDGIRFDSCLGGGFCSKEIAQLGHGKGKLSRVGYMCPPRTWKHGSTQPQLNLSNRTSADPVLDSCSIRALDLLRNISARVARPFANAANCADVAVFLVFLVP